MAFFTEVLSQNSYGDIVTATNGGEARRHLIEREFDIWIINAPLVDESWEEFAKNIVSTGIAQASLIVKADIYDEVSEKVEGNGVITIAKPMNRTIFWSALKLASATYNKMCQLKKENNKLLQKIEDIRMIDRANMDRENEPPKAMKEIWNWKHKGYIEEYSQFKAKLDALKK